jgi:hypothetical protein
MTMPCTMLGQLAVEPCLVIVKSQIRGSGRDKADLPRRCVDRR